MKPVGGVQETPSVTSELRVARVTAWSLVGFQLGLALVLALGYSRSVGSALRAAASGCVACLPPTVTPNAATWRAEPQAIDAGDW